MVFVVCVCVLKLAAKLCTNYMERHFRPFFHLTTTAIRAFLELSNKNMNIW